MKFSPEFSGKPRVSLTTQTEVAECGLACVAMISSYYGLEVDLATLRMRFTAPTRGASLESIINCSEKLGFITRPLRIELEDLGAIRLPAIAHWHINHFVVIEKVTRSKALVHDPNGSSRWLDIADVSAALSGIILEIWPSPEFSKGYYKYSLKLSQLWSSSSGLVELVVKAFIISLSIQLFVMILPLFPRFAIDRAINNPNVRELNYLGIAFLTIVVLHSSIYGVRSRVLLAGGANISYDLAINLGHRMLRLPISWFSSRQVGDVLSKFQSINPIKKTLIEDAASSLLDGISAVASILLMFYFSVSIGFVAIGGLFAQSLLRLFLLGPLKFATRESIIASGREQTNLIQLVQGIRTLRISSALKNRELKWRLRLSESVNADTSLRRIQNNLSTGKVFISNAEGIIFLWVCLLYVIKIKMSIGTAFALFVYRAQFSISVASFLDRFLDVKMLDLHLERISDIALTSEDERFTELPRPVRPFLGKIEFRDVHYRYSEFDQPVLRGVSFCVSPGESLAITGPSGHGKSTIALIALGLIKPNSGVVLIDDMPIETYGYQNYSLHISAVLQDDVLFPGSIFDNISSYSPGAKEEAVRDAARKADIDQDIASFPMGYETLVGDMGATLSGGQKQRILIARALFEFPQLIIIDEGTSHLDFESEARVNASISSLGITRLIIAHRQETIRSADRVITIKNGVVWGGDD